MNPIYTFFCGIIIGVSDLIPGISGGTIALILGVYGPIMEALQDFKKFNFKNKNQILFFILIIFGIGTSLLAFSPIIAEILQNSRGKTYLYAFFFGLVLGSVRFLVREVKPFSFKSCFFTVMGIILALIISYLPKYQFHSETLYPFMYLFLSGCFAVFAMLLPGISGSYVLMLMGPYSMIIDNLSRFSSSLKQGLIEISCFKVLIPVSLGILIGVLVFSEIIAYFLTNFKSQTLSLLLGFMIGSIKEIYPLNLGEPILMPILIISCGTIFVIMLESIAVRRYRVRA